MTSQILYCPANVNANGVATTILKIDTEWATGQARKAAFDDKTKSGDPHRYMNGDHLAFPPYHCNLPTTALFEYPVYWIGHNEKNPEWIKDRKTTDQPGGPTPLRVVYANVNGAVYFCGVMTHATVTADYRGEGRFYRCLEDADAARTIGQRAAGQ